VFSVREELNVLLNFCELGSSKGNIRNCVTARANASWLPVGSCKRSRNNCARNRILESLIIKRSWG
jgi:hypothetical protein